MSHAPVAAECLNCRTALAGPYCSACGQKASTPNPTFHDLMHELLHETLHVDGRVWRSVWLLLAKPGRMTVEYCAGHKARFLTPLRLYLIFSIIAVATSTLQTSHGSAEQTPASQPVIQQRGQREVVKAGNINIDRRLTGKLTPQQVGERVRHAFHDWLPRMNLVLVPLWALLVMLMTRKARRSSTHNFPEYLYFALHANAAFSAAFTLDHLIDLLPWTVADTVGDVISLGYIFCYTVLGLRTVYGGGWIRNVLRSLTIALLYGIIYVVAVGALITLALLL